MNSECPPLESFEDLLALDGDDPRRLHFHECPRCRARAIAFQAFLEPGPLPEGARPGEARVHLSRLIRAEAERRVEPRAERTMELEVERTFRPASEPLAERPGDSRGMWASMAAWFRPGWRPMIGLASVVVVVFLIARVAVDRPQTEAPVMRGGGVAGEFESSLPRAAATADGALSIDWRALPGASRYAVAFYSLDMSEILQVGTVDSTRLTLPSSILQRLGRSGTVVFVRVLAIDRGDPIARSAPVTLTLP